MRRENEVFRENMIRENEIWKAGVQRELREDVRRLVVEKFIADNKPSSSSLSSSNGHVSDEPAETVPTVPPREQAVASLYIPPLPQLQPTGESSHAGPSTAPPQIPPTTETPLASPVSPTRPPTKYFPSAPAPFVLPRKPRIGSYYAAIVDTDGDDPDGALLAHMIEIATYRPGFLFSHTGTPEPHRDCCATLYFATLGNVHDWMHDVNHAYRLDNEEIDRLERNSGELKRKRRFDAFVRICKVEAEDPWEIFERRR
jgi:hypothetical protein